MGSAPTPGSGAWRSLVARSVRDAEVAGSSPAAPTQAIAAGVPAMQAGQPRVALRP